MKRSRTVEVEFWSVDWDHYATAVRVCISMSWTIWVSRWTTSKLQFWARRNEAVALHMAERLPR